MVKASGIYIKCYESRAAKSVAQCVEGRTQGKEEKKGEGGREERR